MRLETERLLIRAHAPADIDPYCDMEADPEVRRYVGGSPRPRDQAEGRFQREMEANAADDMSLWATVYKLEGVYIGRCGVYPHFDANSLPIPGEGTLALYIARSYWGRGLATEAGSALLRHGFTVLKLRRIVASVQEGNDASVRVVEKLGMRLMRTEQGEYRSFLHYEILPDVGLDLETHQ